MFEKWRVGSHDIWEDCQALFRLRFTDWSYREGQIVGWQRNDWKIGRMGLSFEHEASAQFLVENKSNGLGCFSTILITIKFSIRYE